MIFETHAHYDDAKFDTDREMLLAELPQRGISPVINAGSSIATTKTTLSLAQEYPFLYAAVGVHPSDVDDLNEDTYAWLRQQTTLQKTVAVGEIGLDYYWDKEPEIQAKQRYWFVRQLALAQQADLPVIIHSRDAAEDTMKIMEKAYEDGIKGVIHCYSYSPEMAQEYVKMGYFIGVYTTSTGRRGRQNIWCRRKPGMTSIWMIFSNGLTVPLLVWADSTSTTCCITTVFRRFRNKRK